MGGGSSVMGMVAYRGTPDDYANGRHGRDGWGWNDVLPFYRKLEHDLDFGGEMHGNDGPVPIRRTKPDDWAPLSKAVHAYAQERQIPFIADMNVDFRDGYGAVPMSNWPDKRASAAICYLDAAVRARSNLTIINGVFATASCSRADASSASRCALVEEQGVPCARGYLVRRRHPFAGLPDAPGHRARRTFAGT
jgi:5-(hydroxymethyl)furfural/furfural oxidase